MNKKGYKHTPLGWIPEDWGVKRIKDIGIISSGTTPLRSNPEYYTNGRIYWVKTTDLNNSVIMKTEEKVSEKALLETSLRVYPKGTVLVAMYGGFNQIGRTGLLGIEATINQALSAITVDIERTDQEFLLNWLNANVGLWKNFAGSSRKDPNITSNDVGDFPIIDIPLPEQRRIAAILSTWDAAIAKEQQVIDVVQTRHRALMQQLLTGKKRLKGFKGDWKEVKLGEISTERNEIGFLDLPLLSITNSRGVIYQSENDKKDTSNEDKSKYRRICIGDIGYNTMRMWQGRSALSELEGIVSPAYTIVTPNKDQCAAFHSALFKVPFMVNRFFCHSQGLVEDTLNCKYKDFAIVKAKVPTLEEQTAIATILAKSDQEIQTHRRQFAALQQQKKGLMQVLLTGKVRVKTTEL